MHNFNRVKLYVLKFENSFLKMTYLNIILLISLAAILSLPDAYTVGAAIFSIIGMFYLSKRLLVGAPLLEPYLAGKLCLVFMAYALLSAAIQLWHNAPVSHYEMYIPFLWAPLIVLAVLDGHIDRRLVWLGCLLGAMFACLLAVYQSICVGIGRPLGFLGSPITFGNNALLLGSIALAGRHDPPFNLRKPVWLGLAYLGFLFGLAASLVSLSKGGWPLIPVVLLWVLVEDLWRGSRRERFLYLSAAFGLLCLLPLMSLNRHVYRIEAAINGTLTWLKTGQVVDGSAAVRLELWKFGLSIWHKKPWLGYGREDLVQQLHEGIANKRISPMLEGLTGLHNEPIQLLVEQGILGLLSWSILFISTILVFARSYLQNNGIQKILGQAGMITVIASFIFGLSDMNLMLNANRQIFVFLLMVLTALLIAEQKRQ